MSQKICLGVIVLVIAAFSTGKAQTAPFIQRVEAEERSSTSKLLVENYMYELPDSGYRHEIWLVSRADASKRKLLFTDDRHAEILFSPDDHWLCINNHEASNESDVLLFRQKNGVEFEQVANISIPAWEFLEKQMKKKAALDHNYVDAIHWVDDHTVLLCLYGHADSKNHVENWLCFYDILTEKFSTDLNQLNERHTVLEASK